MITYIIAAVLVVLAASAGAVFLLSTRNTLVRERRELAKAWTDLDQLLKQRRDELPRLIGTCRSYLRDGAGLLEAVAAARASEQKAGSPPEKARAASELSGALQSLFAAADRDRALELDAGYRQLKKSLAALDERISAERARFNGRAGAFNARLARLPGRVAAGHLRPQALFEARDAQPGK